MRAGKQILITDDKYDVKETIESEYVSRMSLTIKKFGPDDVRSYVCGATNSLGYMEQAVQVYGTTKTL